MHSQIKALKEFAVGKNNIGWVGSNFKDHLYDLTFTASKEKLETKTLNKLMLDKEIFAEFKPETVTLGNVLHFLSNADRSGCYIFYVNDAKGTPWAVGAFWYAGDGGWYVEARSVEYPYRWHDGYQVVSREFLDTKQQSLTPSDTLPSELNINGITYKRV